MGPRLRGDDKKSFDDGNMFCGTARRGARKPRIGCDLDLLAERPKAGALVEGERTWMIS